MESKAGSGILRHLPGPAIVVLCMDTPVSDRYVQLLGSNSLIISFLSGACIDFLQQNLSPLFLISYTNSVVMKRISIAMNITLANTFFYCGVVHSINKKPSAMAYDEWASVILDWTTGL